MIGDIEEGFLVIAEPQPDGILMKPGVASSLLAASGASGNPWNDWFGLMEQIAATVEEINAVRQDGHQGNQCNNRQEMLPTDFSAKNIENLENTRVSIDVLDYGCSSIAQQ